MNQQIIINNQLISFVKQGSEVAEQTLLFLHGWRSNKEAWGNIIQKLRVTGDGLQVYAIDLPGFGSSPVPKGDWGVEDYANLVAEFIGKLDLKNVVVIGHSFGGRVGIKLASLRIDLVKKLILVDAAGFVSSSPKKSTLGFAAKIVKPIF